MFSFSSDIDGNELERYKNTMISSFMLQRLLCFVYQEKVIILEYFKKYLKDVIDKRSF